MKKWIDNDDWGKRQISLDKVKHYCKCGHTVYVPARNVFVYCNWCNRKVYQDKRSEFEYKLLRSLGKVDNREIRKNY